MGWELVGGDPAPGSPESVRTAATALKQVADLAEEVLHSLTQETAEVGVERWKGTAADTFRQDIAHLPDSLNDVERSYQEASTALRSYGDTLERAQYDARAALTAATQAAADRDQARSRRDSAQNNADALRSQRRSAGVRLESLRLQQSVSLDPVHRSSLDSPIASTRSQVSRLDADVADADHAVARQTAAINEAEDRLRRASGQADGIRKEISDAVDRAVAALKQAERDAHLPGFWTRETTELKEALQTYGPVLVEELQMGQKLFSLAALVFPPGAAVFEAAALICGGSALIIEASMFATQPGGMTTANWLRLGTDAFGVAVNATAFGGLTKLGSATQLTKASSWLGYGQEGMDVGEQYEEHGAKAALFTAGTYVLGAAGEKYVFGPMVRKASAAASKNPTVVHALDAMARDVGHSKTKVLGVPLVSSMSSRSAQSLLTLRRPDGGQFVYGNQASTDPTLADHLMFHDELSDLQNRTGNAVPDFVMDHLRDAVTPAPAPPPQPEIDIDLDPSEYGGASK